MINSEQESLETVVRQLKRGHRALMGQELLEVRDADSLLQRLDKGEGSFSLVLSWGDLQSSSYPHSLQVHRKTDQRVVFFNPNSQQAEAGEELDRELPLRRAEGDGYESVPVEEFRRFFEERGAVGLVSES